MITPVTAIVTAYKRHEQTLETVRCLLACVPPPAEVLVHVDGGRKDMEEALKQAFPTIRILTSESSVGPGGGRNRLVREARENLVASFDDDSHPADADFFQRVVDAATAIPDAAIIAATILDGTEESGPQPGRAMIAANFVGCGCVYRREVFVKTTGYVPLPVAYGMEEVDLSIRLHAMGSKIVHEPRLRVVHDLKHDHRETETVSAAMVANLALLAYLRYPAVLWPLGLWQCLRKAMELLVKGRVKGVLAGLCDIPGHLWHHRGHRKPLKPSVVLSHIRLRRQSPPIQALE